jgi:hypothetical protein
MILGVALLAVLIIAVLIIIVTLVVPSFFGGAALGLRTSNVPYAPALAGNIMGYADVPGQIDGVEVNPPSPDPDLLGPVTLPIQIQYFMTTTQAPPSINMNKAEIFVTTPAGTESLFRSNAVPLEKPAWTIAQQNSLTPFVPPNNNDILEPNEIFVILVYPGTAMTPGEPVSILIRIPSQWPLTVNFTVPDPVQSSMVLKQTNP